MKATVKTHQTVGASNGKTVTAKIKLKGKQSAVKEKEEEAANATKEFPIAFVPAAIDSVLQRSKGVKEFTEENGLGDDFINTHVRRDKHFNLGKL